MDRWLAGWDEGHNGNRGMGYMLTGIAHAHSPIISICMGHDGRAEGRMKRRSPHLGIAVRHGPSGFGVISCPHKQ